MEVPVSIQRALDLILPDRPLQFTLSGGGCINNGGELRTKEHSYFIKWNDAARFPAMFSYETRGLDLLRSAKAIRIPRVVHVGTAEGLQFIILEFIRQGKKRADYWDLLGTQLATLHRHSHATFGLDHENYIGSLPQQNTPHAKWVNFFIECRLLPQLVRGEDSGAISSMLRKKFDALFLRLNELMPEEKPALLHGDLWSGNLLIDDSGYPCLIDPAVYYGNREAELAFTQLFGGFDESFLHVYNSDFPLQPEFTTRIDLYNLYPLLVHVNLFGGSYLQSVERIIKQYR